MSVRRKKPDFVFIWSEEVWPAVSEMSAPQIKRLRAACARRIDGAEMVRQRSMRIITIVDMANVDEGADPWGPFKLNGHVFQLEYCDCPRAYTLKFAPVDPEPGADPPKPPAAKQRAKPAQRLSVKARAKPANAKSARPARTRRPPRQTDSKRSLHLYKLERLERGIKRVRLAISTRLAPIVARKAARAACEAQTLRASWRAIVAKRCRKWAPSEDVVSSFTRLAERPARAFGPGARLEARLLGQNTGLHVLLYTLVWDEPIDWSANLFGLLPEQERMLV